MSSIWHTNIQLLCGNQFLNMSSSRQSTGEGANRGYSITVLSGAQPSAATVAANWNTTYYNTYLLHYEGSYTGSNKIILYNVTNTIQLRTSGISATAANSGTATWAVLWPTCPASVATIPSTQFVVVDVSDTFGSGVVRLNSTSITSGNSYTVDAFYMQFGGGSA